MDIIFTYIDHGQITQALSRISNNPECVFFLDNVCVGYSFVRVMNSYTYPLLQHPIRMGAHPCYELLI